MTYQPRPAVRRGLFAAACTLPITLFALSHHWFGLNPQLLAAPAAAVPAAAAPIQWRDLSPAEVQRLLPAAVRWVEEQEQLVLRRGVALTESQQADARALGVRHPEKVRVLKVEDMPVPSEPALARAAAALVSPATIGLTLRYGIFIRADHWGDRELLAHELVHTRQYEQAGSLAAFLQEYFGQCLFPPYYQNSPLEKQAEQLARQLMGR